MSDEIRANYEQLENVANQFSRQTQAIQSMLQKVKGSMSQLETGWIGRGHDAFFSEMNSVVLPAGQRLQNALQEASTVTKTIAQTMKQAEEDAAAPFGRA
ncbi:MAG TPA: WXG100 family type VII secretion target [Herpetosiphonaceae bacterium]